MVHKSSIVDTAYALEAIHITKQKDNLQRSTRVRCISTRLHLSIAVK